LLRQASAFFVLSIILWPRGALRRGDGLIDVGLPKQSVVGGHFEGPGVVANELALTLANGENWTGSRADNLVGCAAEEHTVETLATMSRDDDEVGAKRTGGFDDFDVWRARAYRNAGRNGLINQFLECLQIPAAVLDIFKIVRGYFRDEQVWLYYVKDNQFSTELPCEGIGVLEGLLGAVGKVHGDEDFFEVKNGIGRRGLHRTLVVCGVRCDDLLFL